ncbi:MAG: DsrE/DsrF/DrsH-like family protein [gamma proteobacterium symbiont of Taylorina sp.]|nr:DsrE/DsrF/DrsH-like family protein [gamma proteobacterium symbiont of Taylorina sp.]
MLIVANENLDDLFRQSNLNQQLFEQWFDKRFDQKLAEKESQHTPSMTIIVTKGTMDMAYPPFILASTASALGWNVSIFFTFYGLSLLKSELDLNISPLGNPAMPMKMPVGPDWLRQVEMDIPNFLMAGVPGFEKMATTMMKKTLTNKGVASILELRDICIESEVKMIACQMTVDLFDWSRDDFIPEISEWVGAASFLPIAQKAEVNLFI